MDNKPINGDALKSKSSNAKNKKIFVLLGVLVLMIIIVIILAAQSKKSISRTGAGQAVNTNQSANSSTTANAVVSVKSDDLTPAPIATGTNLTKEGTANLKTAKVVVPGANPISSNNVVLTPTGEPTNASAQSTASNAPKQTGFLDKATLPKTLAQTTIANNAFTPNTITTQAGAPTSFALTSGDNLVHVLNFDDSSLSAIAILVGPGQTKAITFNAPKKAGSYIFHDSTPGSTATGTLVVK